MNLEHLTEQPNQYLNQVVDIEDAYLVVDMFGNCFLYPQPFEGDICRYYGVTVDFENLQNLIYDSEKVGTLVGGKIIYHNKVKISGTVQKGTTEKQPLRLTKLTKLIIYQDPPNPEDFEDHFKII